MTSCEDLRWRMVWQREALGKKCKDVAANLCVDLATVSRTVARFREIGLVLKKCHQSRRSVAFRKLTVVTEMSSTALVSIFMK